MSTTMNLMAASASGSQSVMASQRSVSVKSSAKASASKDGQSDSKPFSSMLDKAKGSTADNSAAQKTDDAAANQGQAAEQAAKPDMKQQETAKTTDKPSASENVSAGKDAAKDEKQDAVDAKAGALSGLFTLPLGMVAAAVQQQAAVQTDNSKTSDTPAANTQQSNVLEALLPQNTDAKQSVQNQQLLEMLSSTGNKTAAASVISPNTQQNSTPVLQALTEKGVGSAENFASSVQAATSSRTEPGVQTSVTTTAASANDGSTAASSLLAGVKLTVDDQTQNQNNPMQQQPDNRFMQPSSQPDAQSDVQPDIPGMQQQLPEEARFDTAPVQSDGNQTTSSSQVNVFQQASQVQDASAAQASGTQASANTQAPDFDVPRQIVEQAKLIRSTEDTQMVIKLKPEHLGELTLKVSVSANGSVNASFHTDNAQVRAILENTMVQLRQDLQSQGLKVDNVSVYAGLSDNSLLNSQQQSQNFQQQGGGSARSQKIDLAMFEEETEAVSAVQSNETSAADGIDYRI